jgi:hypothetical protein
LESKENAGNNVTVGVQTWIPYDYVGPFMGDGRDHQAGQGGTFRTQQIVTVDFEQHQITPVVTDVAATHWVTGKPTNPGSPDQLKLVDSSIKWDDGSVAFTLTGSAPSPACQSVCPHIDYTITYTLYQQGNGAVKVAAVGGTHDGFPAYETFAIQGAHVVYYEAYQPPHWWDAVKLFGTSDQTFGPR